MIEYILPALVLIAMVLFYYGFYKYIGKVIKKPREEIDESTLPWYKRTTFWILLMLLFYAVFYAMFW